MRRIKVWYDTASLWVGRIFIAGFVLQIGFGLAAYTIECKHAGHLLTLSEFCTAMDADGNGK